MKKLNGDKAATAISAVSLWTSEELYVSTHKNLHVCVFDCVASLCCACVLCESALIVKDMAG